MLRLRGRPCFRPAAGLCAGAAPLTLEAFGLPFREQTMNIEDVQPLSRARVQGMSSTEYDEAEMAIIHRIIQIAEKHCAENGVELKIDKKPTTYWFLFGCNLDAALIPHAGLLGDAKYLAFLRRLFEEIFDFLMFAYDGEPAYTIHELSRAFGSSISTGPVLPMLLPARAHPILAAVSEIADAEHEELMRRQDQMGY